MDHERARSELRAGGRWRAAILGLRTALLGFLLLLTLMLVVRFVGGEEVIVPIIFVVLAVTIGSILTGWLAALLLVRDTSRYTGASSGRVNPARLAELVRAVGSDLTDLRRW
ncbi:hypothetical protein ACFY2Q_01305 [Micromonospora sp. NPDC000316]|uniref:hypothetical protein n=1 Tax=Micromonospora sp. NPDC000316 TaxID=3364216 RepID=UPI0036A6DE73